VIQNATLLSIQTPGASTTGGDPGTPSVQTVCARCFADEPTRSQLIALANRISGATAVLYVEKAILLGVSFAPGQTLTTRVDAAAAPASLQILWVRDRQMQGALSHWEIYAKELI
jgi:hypothetical protein